MDKSEIDLKLLSAYWCNHVAADYEERFFWAWEKVSVEITNRISNQARLILIALAKSAPNEHGEAYLAAGPLEDYINLIVKKRLAGEAAFIVNNSDLYKLLVYVWGDVIQLEPLARSYGKAKKKKAITPRTDLQSLDLKEVTGFWCHMAASKIVTDYDEYYARVENKLLDKKSREQTMHDLLLSAPDKEAEAYLYSKIFILQQV